MNTRVIERQRDELQESDRQLVQANEDLKQLAATDPLTGLLNRREFVRELTMVVEHQKRSGRHHGVAVLDLNGFKSINDTYGHVAGDEVLIQSAHRLHEIARPYDIVARLGGDEFCLVVLDMADDEDLASLGERLTEHMAAAYTISAGSPGSPGIIVEAPASIGLTLQRADEPVSIDEVLARADRAMYRAKRTRSGYILAAGGMGQW
jgi:diguanylate cyclase (GGDEF)-like protein